MPIEVNTAPSAARRRPGLAVRARVSELDQIDAEDEPEPPTDHGYHDKAHRSQEHGQNKGGTPHPRRPQPPFGHGIPQPEADRPQNQRDDEDGPGQRGAGVDRPDQDPGHHEHQPRDQGKNDPHHPDQDQEGGDPEGGLHRWWSTSSVAALSAPRREPWRASR